MADQNYEIQLNLKVNDAELRDAENRIRNLGDAPVGVRGGGRTTPYGYYGRRYKWIPESHRDPIAGAARFFNRNYGASRENFLSNVNEAYRRSHIFRHNFLGNTATISGMMRNLSNFGSVIAQIGRVAVSAVPALGRFSAALSAIVIGKGIQYGITGGALFIGNKILKNENIAQGAANLMQMGMAQKGLGGLYQSSLNEATRIAAEYGFSRTGILGTITTLTGMDIGKGKQLTQQDAVRIAQISGKIAHTGGAPYERVAINMQQLFGQPTPSAIDLRQLITSSQAISTIAQRQMREKGITGKVTEYLKDKTVLMSVLNEFDSWVESNPFMQNRGKVALYKENFYMSLANMDPSVWEKISEGMRVFYEQMGREIPRLINQVASSIDPETIREGVKSIVSTINAVGWFLKAISKTIGGISDVIDWIDTRVGSVVSRVVTGVSGWVQKGSARYNYVGATYNEQADSIMYRSDKTWFGASPVRKKIGQKSIDDAIEAAKQRALSSIPASKRGEMYSRLIPVYRNQETDILPYRFVLPPADNYNLDIAGSANTGNMATQDELSDISKGARGLIINFNREIVNMPVNIDQVNNGTDLADRIRDSLYDVIVRGLNISLNNATGAI